MFTHFKVSGTYLGSGKDNSISFNGAKFPLLGSGCRATWVNQYEVEEIKLNIICSKFGSQSADFIDKYLKINLYTLNNILHKKKYIQYTHTWKPTLLKKENNLLWHFCLHPIFYSLSDIRHCSRVGNCIVVSPFYPAHVLKININLQT